MSKHDVRGTASGEYECSCGARWDRDEGSRCPATVALSELPGMWEPSDLSGRATDCEPKGETFQFSRVGFYSPDGPMTIKLGPNDKLSIDFAGSVYINGVRQSGIYLKDA